MHHFASSIPSAGRSFARPLLRLGLGLGLGLTVTACGDDTSEDPPSSTSDSTGTPSSTGPGTTSSTAPTGTDATPPGTEESSGDSGPADSGDSDTGDTSDTGDSGDSGDSSSTGTDRLEIIGEWFEEFAPGMGITHSIDAATWSQMADFGDALFHIDSYDNVGRWAVAQNDAANAFDPNLYSKFNWTWDGADLYYCTAVFNAETAADAMTAPDADDSDLAMGCGGFPWSLLMPN